jgi:hypothetical protein
MRAGEGRGEKIADRLVRSFERRIVCREIDGADDAADGRRCSELTLARRGNQIIDGGAQIAPAVATGFQPH